MCGETPIGRGPVREYEQVYPTTPTEPQPFGTIPSRTPWLWVAFSELVYVGDKRKRNRNVPSTSLVLLKQAAPSYGGFAKGSLHWLRSISRTNPSSGPGITTPAL